MGNKLYVGNLPFSCSDVELADHFTGFGTVASARVVYDRQTGRSKGFGFVEMNTDEEAQNAVQELHGKDFMGRPLTVNEARPREEGTSPRDRFNRDRGPRDYGSRGNNHNDY
jgi:RNA recognition motif-containing protein